MHIAQLGAADAPRYRLFMLNAYAAAPDAFTSTPEERAGLPKSWWVQRLADLKGLSLGFGAWREQELVGAVTLEFSSRPKTRHKAHLIGMFVDASCRGTGVGAALLQAALSQARTRQGLQVVTLTVTEGNFPAIKLYERFGFSSFGIEPMAIATPQGFKGKVHMWLRLAPATPG